jgi:hypothetical protein
MTGSYLARISGDRVTAVAMAGYSLAIVGGLSGAHHFLVFHAVIDYKAIAGAGIFDIDACIGNQVSCVGAYEGWTGAHECCIRAYEGA